VPFYVLHQQFKLLVRLLTGTKQYARLQYLFDILVKYDCFEYMLGKNVVGGDEEEKKEIQMAIFNFLKQKYPQDDNKMKLFFLRFSMFREYADMLYNKAITRLQSQTPPLPASPSPSPSSLSSPLMMPSQKLHLSVTTLLDVMDKLLDAAEYYGKAESLHRGEECYRLAELVAMQIENPETQFINLDVNHVTNIITHIGNFEQAYVLAKAYKVNEIADWIGPVYHQVIENGNFEFLSSLSGVMPLPNQFFQEIARKWKSSTPKKKPHLANLKTFLLFLDDHVIRNEILNSVNGYFGTTKS